MLSLSLSLSAAPPNLLHIDVFRHHSATARCRVVNNVLHIAYSGAISQIGFQHLDRAVQPWRRGVAVALERMDAALTMVAPAAPSYPAWPHGTPPSIVIVRDDQYAAANAFGAYLARSGVIRIAFLRSQEAMALALVERIVG